MTDFSIEELDAVGKALGELREKQKGNGTLHMGFLVGEVRDKVPTLADKSDKYIQQLLGTLQKAGESIQPDGIGIGPWKFV